MPEKSALRPGRKVFECFAGNMQKAYSNVIAGTAGSWLIYR